MTTIKLQSGDKDIIPVNIKVAKCCGRIKTTLEDYNIECSEETLVRLPHVSTKTLHMVLDWIVHHINDPPLPGLDPKIKGVQTVTCQIPLTAWDAHFLKFTQDELFQLSFAASYLEVQSLFTMTTQILATMSMGKTAEELNEAFNTNFTEPPKDIKSPEKAHGSRKGVVAKRQAWYKKK